MARTTPVTDQCSGEGTEHRDLTQTPPWGGASELGSSSSFLITHRLPSRRADCPQRAGGQAATGEGTGARKQEHLALGLSSTKLQSHPAPVPAGPCGLPWKAGIELIDSPP